MATTTRILDANVNGTVYTSNANSALEALDTCHSGAVAPTDEVANGKLWLDTSTTPGILKIYNNATWEVVHSGTVDINGGTIDGTVIGGTTPAAVTASVLNVSGGTSSQIVLNESDTTNLNTRIINNTGKLSTQTWTDAGGLVGTRMLIDHGTGDISFYEDTGTTAKFFWDASLETLTLGGTEWPTSNIGEAAGRHMINYDGEPRLFLWDTSTGAAGNEAHLMLGGKPTSSATTISGGSINGGVENAVDADGYLAFNTTNGAGTFTEAMRIDASGNVLVGKTSAVGSSTAGHELRSGGLAYHTVASNACLVLNRTTTAGEAAIFRYNNATVGSISVTGSATAYNTSSDYRLKENITPVQGAADIVKAMQPVTYTFKSDGSWHDGFLAHELQELHPRAVIGSKDAMVDEEYEVTPAVLDDDGNVVTEAVMGTRSVPDYQGVDYSKLTPILTAALQEALNKIDALEARVAALEL